MGEFVEISIEEDFANNNMLVHLSIPRRTWTECLMNEPSDTPIMGRLIHLIEESKKE